MIGAAARTLPRVVHVDRPAPHVLFQRRPPCALRAPVAKCGMPVDLVEAFRAAVRGPVIGPDDAPYDRARGTFNALIDARPAVIVRPVDPADVSSAVRLAAERGLPVSVRGGGHSVAGHSVGQGGVMVDLRLFREVVVDPDARTAVVGGGCCWNDVDAATQAHGMAMPGGTYGDTGVAGLTLTGGIGHLIGAFGLTLDNLLSAELVTASGEVVVASEDREPDLFWALRGGGGNFGVVTTFTFRIHPVPLMAGGLLAHRAEDAAAVLKAFARMRDDLPDELTHAGVDPARDNDGAARGAHGGRLPR